MEDLNFYPISLSLVALIYACFFIRRLSSSKSPSPPSPPSLPIIGNIHQLGKLPHRSLSKLSQKHGPLMLLRFGPKPVLVVSSADMARQILKTHDRAFADKPVMEFLNRLFYGGNDVINLPYGDTWRKLRNIILHELLNSSRVRSFGSIREEETSLLMARIEELSAASQPVNLSGMLVAAVSDLITRAAFGKKYSETERGRMFLEFVEEASGMFEFTLRDSFPLLRWIDRWNGRGAAVDRLMEKRDASLDSIIQDHLQSSDASRDNIMGILLGIYNGDIPGVSIDLMSVKGVILVSQFQF